LSQPNTLLMWPGPEAEDLKSFLARQRHLGTTDVKYTLVILDGTWHQARSLYNQNSFLHSLKQVKHFCKCCLLPCLNNTPRCYFLSHNLRLLSLSIICSVITRTDDSCRDMVFTTVYRRLSVFCIISQITDAARITKRDLHMFHDESCKSIYYVGQKVKGQSQPQKRCWRGSLHSCECWLFLVV